MLPRPRAPIDRLLVLDNGVELTRFDPPRQVAVRTAVRAELGVGDAEVAVGLVGRLVAENGYRVVFTTDRRRATRPTPR